MIEWPHDGESLFRFISQIIFEWNLGKKKLFSMVVDNATANDSMVRHLKIGFLTKFHVVVISLCSLWCTYSKLSCAGQFELY